VQLRQFMPLTILVLPALMVVSGMALYLPYSFVPRQEQLDRQEFVKRYPQFKWLQADLLIDVAVFALILLVFAVGILLRPTLLSLGLFSLIFSGLATWNGLMTARTGICRVPYPRMRYRYVYAPALRSMGPRQFILGFTLMASAIVLAVL
jgi:hypothetical protein